jgi:hypothetical protein
LLDILTMHLPINVKSPNNISKWHMGINSAFKGLNDFSVPSVVIPVLCVVPAATYCAISERTNVLDVLCH